MQKKLAILAAIFFYSTAILIAQTEKISYSGLFNLGVFYGSNKTKLQVQTIHGIKVNTWFAGAGVGIDDYFQQSIPVFLDIRKDILKKSSTPFIYADGGINIIDKETKTEYQKTERKSGIFYEGGVGYKITLNAKLALNIACGYSFKSYEENTFNSTYNYTNLNEPGWINSTTEKFKLQRFAMKIGIQF